MTGRTSVETPGGDRRRLIRRETILGAVFLGISAVLMVAVLAGGTQAFDQRAWEFFQRMRSDSLDVLVRQITALGNFLTLVVASIGLAVTLRYAMNVRVLGFLAACIVGGRVLHILLRTIVDRPRPVLIDTLWAIDASSFPSGHAMMSMVVYPTFALLIAEQIPQPRVRIGLVVSAFALASLIGVSRLYLGVHYVTDVVAGWSAGLFWLSACWEFRAQRLRRREPAATGR
jgi:undecaprenyl-diphosphatase